MAENRKSRIPKIVLILLCVCLIWATAAFVMWRVWFYDPYNDPAMDYIWESEEIRATYGTVTRIITNTKDDPIEEGEDWQIRAYEVYSEEKEISMLVRIEQDGRKWHAVSYEVVEVRDAEPTNS